MTDGSTTTSANTAGNLVPLLGHIALAAGLIRDAAGRAATASDPAAAQELLSNVLDYSDAIQKAVGELTVVLECGPETLEAVDGGLKRLFAFWSCQSLGGRA